MKKDPDFPVPREEIKIEADLDPIIEGLLDGTFVPVLSNEEMENIIDRAFDPALASDELYDGLNEALASLLPERNGLVAILISRVWYTPAFEPARKKLAQEEGPLEAKLARSEYLFQRVIDYWFDFQEELGEESECYVFIERLQELLNFVPSNKKRAVELVKEGAGTANDTVKLMINMTLAKEAELGIILTKEEFDYTVERALFKGGTILASMQQNTTVNLLEVLEPKHFRFEKEAKGYALKLIRDELPHLKDREGVLIFGKEHEKDRTRCPGLYPVGDKPPVIPAYFKWAMEMIRSTPKPEVPLFTPVEGNEQASSNFSSA